MPTTTATRDVAQRFIGQFSHQRLARLSRQMSVSILLLTIVVLGALLVTVPENQVMLVWLLGITIAFSIGMVLDKLGFYQVNQFLLSTGLSLFLLFSTMHSKIVNAEMIHEGSYFNPRYFLIGLSFIPMVIFDLRRQKWTLLASVILNTGILLFYIPIHRLFGAAPLDILGEPLKNNVFVTVASSSAAMAITAGMFFLKRANYRYEGQIEGLVAKTSFQNEELNAGIRYAARLQQSVLPNPKDETLCRLPFTIFQSAKDKLSGDFFFLENRKGIQYASVVDCTGHGVPGAFVSLMANSCLKQAMDVQPDPSPAFVLHSLQYKIEQEFRTAGQRDMRDGMDMTLCKIDARTRSLTYASALGIAFLVKEDEVILLDNERRSIGDDNPNAFTDFSCAYETGDLLVMTSDGYKDQFGGPRSKKFGRNQLVQLLASLHGLPAHQIENKLRYTFEKWKGRGEQTDDVCVMVIEL
jgi:serine phosphatase RsbU (regulator of sigma subunit)